MFLNGALSMAAFLLFCALSCSGAFTKGSIPAEGTDVCVNGTELCCSREQENPIKPSTIATFHLRRVLTRSEGPISSLYFTDANASGAVPLGGSSSRERSWCVARESASPDSLQTALDWVCAYGGADCEAIKLGSGSGCYVPNNVCSHASYAFNSYYQIHGHASGSCDFNGVATITYEDPSYPGCSFPFRLGQLGATANSAKVWFANGLALASFGLYIFV